MHDLIDSSHYVTQRLKEAQNTAAMLTTFQVSTCRARMNHPLPFLPTSPYCCINAQSPSFPDSPPHLFLQLPSLKGLYYDVFSRFVSTPLLSEESVSESHKYSALCLITSRFYVSLSTPSTISASLLLFPSPLPPLTYISPSLTPFSPSLSRHHRK
jgi:hypothetical protein